MRRRTAGLAREHPVSHVNVTPMIDVVMCLIVFYLIVGRLVLERRGQVSLPVSMVGDAAAEHADPVVVSIERDGTIRLDGREITLGALPDALALRGKGRVRLRGDRSLAYEVIRPVLDACRDAGITSIELATEQGS